MKILLIAHGKNTHPMGLVDIYNYLRLCKFDVDFIHIGEKDKLTDVKYKPDYVGVTSMTQESKATVDVVNSIKQLWPQSKIILGGRYFVDDILKFEENRLVRLADYIVIGEGEYAIRNIIVGEEENKIVYGEQLSKEDYLKLPLPDKEFIKKYMWLAIKGPHIRTILTRGCPFNCTFCGGLRCPVIRKEPDVAAWYIRKLTEWFNNKKIFIYDDIFTVSRKWLREFKEECIKQSVNAKIRCFIHGRMFDEELFDLLLSVGVDFLCLGAESGDNNILELVNKKCVVEDYLRIDNIIKRSPQKVKFECLWMIGNVGDTKETMRKTVELSRRIGNVKPWFSYAIPFPGTVFWTQAKRYGKIVNNNFHTWGNRDIVFVPNGTTIEEMRYWYGKGRK